MTELLALAVAVPLVAMAVWIVAVADMRAALFGFFALGLLMALAWVLLKAVDVALTEAAIGGGATGILLLRMTVQAKPRPLFGPPPGAAVRLCAGVLCALVAGGLFALLLALPEPAPSLAASVVEHLPETELGNPVTAVLLAYRALDTLLEIVVLLLAVVGAWSLGSDAAWGGRPVPWQPQPPSPAMIVLARLLIPFGILFAGYLIWIGADEPGGKFQASTLLAAMWLLAAMAGLAPLPRTGDPRLRAALALGPLAFLAAGVLGLATMGSFLAWPEGFAKPVIVAVELALTVSVVAALVLLVTGPAGEARR